MFRKSIFKFTNKAVIAVVITPRRIRTGKIVADKLFLCDKSLIFKS